VSCPSSPSPRGAVDPCAPSAARLAAYGSLGFPFAAAFIALQVIVPTWYAQNTALSLSLVGVLLLVARLVDTVTDPLVGWLSDRATMGIGRRKGFVLIAAPFVAVSVWQLFMPPEGAGGGHLLFWTVAVYLAGTVALVPMAAWAAELSPDYHQRSRITGTRVAFGLAGTLVSLSLVAWLGVEDAGPALAAITVLVVITLAGSCLWAGIAVPDIATTDTPGNPFAAMRPLLSRANPFRQLLLAFLLNAVGNAIPATLFLLFVTHRLEQPGLAGPMLFAYFIAATLSVPAWVRISRRLGKHRTWGAGILLACTFFVAAPFIDAGNASLFWVVVLVTGFAAGSDLAMPASINADVIEWDELESGYRRPGLFFALWGTASKLSYALAIGIAFPLLEAGGFDADGPNSPASLAWLGFLYGGPCIAFKLAALWVMRDYPIDEAAHADIRTRLTGRHSGLQTPAQEAGVT